MCSLRRYSNGSSETQPGKGGEIQLTDAMAMLIEHPGLHGVVTESGSYDTGQKLDWLRANVELALRDPEIGADVRAMLTAVIEAPRAEVIPLDEARTHILDRVAPTPGERVSLDVAHGLVLAEPIVSIEAVPPFANTAMDGFALQAADTTAAPVTLDLIGTIAAGDSPI